MMHMPFLFLYIKLLRYFRYALSRNLRPPNLLIYQQFYLKYSIPYSWRETVIMFVCNLANATGSAEAL